MKDREHLGTLVDAMAGWGSGPAIVEHRGVRRFRMSYGSLAEMARRFAAELERRAIPPGARVLIWGGNSAEWVAAFFGCVLRGVLAVPLDAAGSRAFAEQVARETGAKLLVGDRALVEGVPGLDLLRFDEIARLPEGRATPVALTPETPLQILFTSGTTGAPKGVVHTHRNLLASLGPIEREIAKYRKYERWFHPLRIAHTLPLSHVFGQFMGLWVAPVLGAAVHYESRVGEILDLLPRERINVLAAVPRTLGLLQARLAAEFPGLEEAVAAARGLPAAQRWWRFRAVHRRLGWRFWASVCGGATLPEPLEEFWTGLGCALVQGYGLTETAALVTLNHPFRTARGSLGTPLPGRSLRVSASGELEVAGAMVASSAWEDGQLVVRATPWLRTGDLAEMGEDGRLRFRGRAGQRLVTAAGLNVYLQDIEQALEAQPGIVEAVVFAQPGIGGGEEPAAVIAGSPQGVARANAALGAHQQVRRWWVWPDARLPRTASGKVRRAEVEAWARSLRSAGPAQVGPAQAAEQDAAVRLLLSLGLRQGSAEDDARLDEDWGLDSMGRVALASALESPSGDLEQVRTLGELRQALGVSAQGLSGETRLYESPAPRAIAKSELGEPPRPRQTARYRYPEWPFHPAMRWVRVLFTEAVARPLVLLLARPRVRGANTGTGPLLIIANHRTAIDAALVLWALPFPLRSRLAIAMSGELLLGWENSWNRRPLPAAAAEQRRWWGPLAAPAVRACLGVFPLPRTSGFRQSFAFAGRLLDRGCSVLIFPEGRRAQADETIRFRPGLGLLAGESFVPVLPVGLRVPGWRGLEVSFGPPTKFEGSPEAETRRLESIIAGLAAASELEPIEPPAW